MSVARRWMEEDAMQIGPSLSLFQALGTSPAAPQTVRMTSGSEVREHAGATSVGEPAVAAQAAQPAGRDDRVATATTAAGTQQRGTRLDIVA